MNHTYERKGKSHLALLSLEDGYLCLQRHKPSTERSESFLSFNKIYIYILAICCFISSVRTELLPINQLTMEQEYDLLIVADATASMNHYLASLKDSLPQIISISALTGCFSRIGLLAYRDYGDKDLLEWSGWLNPSLVDSDATQPDLPAAARSLQAHGGDDYPEAVKTALAKAYEEMRPEAKTIILLYTDAPPHLKRDSIDSGRASHTPREVKALSERQSYGGFGPMFVDWVSACNQLGNGEKEAQVFCILEETMKWKCVSLYNYLCAVTRGYCVYLEYSKPQDISQVTMELLLAWMGIEKAGSSQQGEDVVLPAYMSHYMDVEEIEQIKSEEDKHGAMFFAAPYCSPADAAVVSSNITSTRINHNILRTFLPKKDNPVTDFARSWSTEPAYRALAVKHLRKIITEDVSAITLNPVFGTLWRAICSDRKHDARDELVEAFGFHIEKITNADERTRLKTWLEESYNFTADVLEAIGSVPEEKRFPCVFLDPTMGFAPADSVDNDGTSSSLTAFTRAELLEIGRSCDFRVLRRLGRVLTKLTYVERPADMPEHIAMTSDEDVPKIPMALVSREYKATFWKILLHTIVPGTMLSTRAAALLAALSLRLGVTPLTQAAEREMMGFRRNWNDIEIPENWNVSCLTLLLHADRAYRQRQEGLESEAADKSANEKPQGLLREGDRALFESLCTFKMLELNLDSTLTARIGWKPEKAMASIGPLVPCRSCKYPRSVTIMGENEKCGICLSMVDKSPEKIKNSLHTRVSMEDNGSTQAAWVECSVWTCRAQYVVYDVDALNVRPKCHYCRRKEIPAPCVECKQCLNRVIWPEAYRPESFVTSDYICPPCSSGLETIVGVETTAKIISSESSISWLICNPEDAEANPFTGSSLHRIVFTIGTDNFLSRFKFFPPIETPLTLRGKVIRNTPELVSSLQDRISNRQTERATCSLCFSTSRKDAVRPACGRRGCFQRICNQCLSGWYGLNRAGRIINISALSCPFCRRFPSPKTLTKYGMGIHAVKNLKNAAQDQGTWIYAWCHECHTAKQYVERVCARGMPAELSEWSCYECQETHENAGKASGIRECPGCGTMIERIAGCGHISCPVEGCGTEWCYFCGAEGPAEDVYNHIDAVHSGLFDGVEDEDEDDDGEYD